MNRQSNEVPRANRLISLYFGCLSYREKNNACIYSYVTALFEAMTVASPTIQMMSIVLATDAGAGRRTPPHTTRHAQRHGRRAWEGAGLSWALAGGIAARRASRPDLNESLPTRQSILPNQYLPGSLKSSS